MLTKTQQTQFAEIKKLYPNIPDATVADLVAAHPTDEYDIYVKLRYAATPYNVDRAEFEHAMRAARRDTDDICHHDLMSVFNSREFRTNHGLRSPHAYELNSMVKYHVALNVRLSDQLFNDLDRIMSADRGKYIHWYKYIKYFKDYQLRHDPIVMYMFDRDANTEKQIASVAMPFARSNDGLIGEMLAPGVAITPETSNRPEYKHCSVGEVVAKRINEILSRTR